MGEGLRIHDNKTVVIGVTGGIAAYKALDIVSKLKKMNINVHVIMTKGAAEFVMPLSFQALSQNIVTTDMFEEPKLWEIEHIALAKKADVFVIAPATANIIGKIAGGIADDMLSTTVMATRAPVLIAPAMNSNMYDNPIVQRNIEILKAMGYIFTDPDTGRLACGDIGNGKLADTDKIVDMIDMLLFDNKDLLGKRVLVTAGPTREDIDPVRYITNRSSGKMGYAIARAARNRGASVTLISGHVNIKPPALLNYIEVYSAEDMYNIVLENAENMDIIIKSAAVADYKPENTSNIKIKKSDMDMNIKLTKNKDILMDLGNRKNSQIIVGFAAETNDIIKNARVKIQKKKLDMIVANDVSKADVGFDVDTNSVKIIKNDDTIVDIPNMSKDEVAHKILDEIVKIQR
jgi:phosphopantothenoylcysteine decarboxylase / phosphopantothenate---cysteine ligase